MDYSFQTAKDLVCSQKSLKWVPLAYLAFCVILEFESLLQKSTSGGAMVAMVFSAVTMKQFVVS